MPGPTNFLDLYSGEISDVRTRRSLYLSLVRSVFGYSNDQNQNDQILQWQPNLLPSGQMQNHNLYQRSFFIRATRTWNSLPTTLRSPDINIRQFKTDLQTYYLKALRECCFNGEDPRTWKTICLKCNTSRYLRSKLTLTIY